MKNLVILVCNLGADPESRMSQSGTAVANLRVATTERMKDRDGNWGEQTEWHRVVCFGRTAENVTKFCRKGRQLYIEGRLQTRKWTDKQGQERWSTEIVANDVRFLGGKDGGEGRSSGGGSGGGRRDDYGSPGGPDEGIPF